MSETLPLLLGPTVVPFTLGALAIIVGTIYGAIKAAMIHRERMAMIRAGMHPDAVQKKDAPECTAGNKPAKYTEWSKPA